MNNFQKIVEQMFLEISWVKDDAETDVGKRSPEFYKDIAQKVFKISAKSLGKICQEFCRKPFSSYLQR
jgi:hypothetical protein